MYILSINMWFQTIMKQFFFGIDQIVYNFISSIYDLLITIARTSVLSQAQIIEMADRIYNLLAVFMIFKVTFSLITYVVNPDDFSDKSKGVSKLGVNIIISLALLVLTPYIFNYAFRLQTIILEDNSLAHLVFGTNQNCGGEGQEECAGDFLNTAGDEIAFLTMQPFFTPNTSILELQSCVDMIDPDTGKVRKECSGLNDKYEVESKKNTMASLFEDEDMILLKNYVVGINNRNLGLMFRQDLAVAKTDVETADKSYSDTVFIMDYKYIFSTVVGVIVVLLLISFCMDVALRSIKLAFLQLIAPIPILSYIDPKSGKDGMFKKWYQMCLKTFISLFLRLLVLYFAVYIISMVSRGNLVDIVDGSYQTNGFVKIFIIIGALMFAKNFTKILEGLGVKLDGDGKFTLNPLRKMENQMAGGNLLKKPNDALAKFGKGVLKSPITGASLGAKKLAAGIDSVRNGGTWRAGTGSVKGGLSKKYDKWLSDNLPMTAERRKNASKGEISQLNREKRTKIGEKNFNNVNEGLDKRARETIYNDNGVERSYKNSADWKKKDPIGFKKAQIEAEAGMFKNAEYARTYAKVANAKIAANEKNDKARNYSQIYQSILSGGGTEVDGVWYGDKTGDAYSDYVRRQTAANQKVEVVSKDELNALVSSSAAAAKSADGKLEMAKKEHEESKLMYAEDANIENSYDEYSKFNDWTSKSDSSSSQQASSNESQIAPSTTDSSTSPQTTSTNTTVSSNPTSNESEEDKNRRDGIVEYEKSRIRAQIDNLNSQIRELEANADREINNFNTVISSLEKSITDSNDEQRNAKLKQEIEQYKSRISTIESNLNDKKNPLLGRIRNLEDKLSRLK